MQLEYRPDYLLFGTILQREMTVAPTRGLVMTVGYRLEFYHLATGESTVVEATVRDLFPDCIPSIVKAFGEKIAGPS